MTEQQAPRVTKEHLESIITNKAFHRLSETLTVCVLTLHNGFTVTGESACVSPANYNQEIGEKVAYQNAFDKLWQLEGYALKNKLAGF
ncbi:Gp49 family protein [Mannheimia sp. AT1]|uniref:Gp49 family protein n=1 Tax=Mannheimia cairinae TaxID=3025936 RepID=A0ABT5MNK0_9PAST|nr:Gp49 family protein [Mannheimia cairinae]MDD0823750.1 Gp49 family protein [Mannheimia cairinae]MDD0825318.1 Gp49 family protein [Mannheimia cairinae]